MSSNTYYFLTHWTVEGTLDEVCEILEDTASLGKWWPSVYLDVKISNEGDAKGVGKIVKLYTKGWLPYRIHWDFEVTESNAPYGYKIKAWGDLEGIGEWTLRAEGNKVYIDYDWRVNGEKPLFKYLSFMLKPIFSANHHWAMRKGEESLKLELLRRRGVQNVPEPPKATL